jgi:hypothetical protein
MSYYKDNYYGFIFIISLIITFILCSIYISSCGNHNNANCEIILIIFIISVLITIITFIILYIHNRDIQEKQYNEYQQKINELINYIYYNDNSNTNSITNTITNSITNTNDNINVNSITNSINNDNSNDNNNDNNNGNNNGNINNNTNEKINNLNELLKTDKHFNRAYLLIRIEKDLIEMKEKELNNFMMNNLKDIRNINEETIKYYLNINNINLKNYKDNLKSIIILLDIKNDLRV